MFKSLRFITLFSVLFMMLPAQAVIIKGTIYRKKIDENKYQYVYCLSDLHMEDSPEIRARFPSIWQEACTQKQRLLTTVEKCSRGQTKIIVEDCFSTRFNRQILPGWLGNVVYSYVKNMLILPGTAYECAQKNMDVVNVEIRHKQRSGNYSIELLRKSFWRSFSFSSTSDGWELFPQIFNDVTLEGRWEIVKAAIAYLQKNHIYSVQDILNDFEQTVKTIKSYDDGNALNEYYADLLTDILEESVQTRSYMKNFDGSFEEFKKSHEVISDSPLLDIKALHEIYQSQDKTKIFVFMGAGHIRHITDILEQLGYEKIYNTGLDDNECEKRLLAYYLLEITKRTKTCEERIVFLEHYANTAKSYQLGALCRRHPIDLSLFDRCLADDPTQFEDPIDSEHFVIQ